MRTKFIGIVLATCVLIAPAYADAIFTATNHPQPLSGQTISSVTIDSASGFQTLKQQRISGISDVTAVVPEPFTLLLVGSSVLGLAWVVRRKMS